MVSEVQRGRGFQHLVRRRGIEPKDQLGQRDGGKNVVCRQAVERAGLVFGLDGDDAALFVMDAVHAGVQRKTGAGVPGLFRQPFVGLACAPKRIIEPVDQRFDSRSAAPELQRVEQSRNQA